MTSQTDEKKEKIQKQIYEVKDWHKKECNRIDAEKRKRLKEVYDTCEHEYVWEHRMRETIVGFRCEYRGTCKICGKEINQEEKPKGVDDIPETSDTFIMTW